MRFNYAYFEVIYFVIIILSRYKLQTTFVLICLVKLKQNENVIQLDTDKQSQRNRKKKANFQTCVVNDLVPTLVVDVCTNDFRLSGPISTLNVSFQGSFVWSENVYILQP